MQGRVEVVEDSAALARAAADRFVARLAQVHGRQAVCLTGGGTPETLYRLLATDAYRSRIPWKDIHWFWTDERFVSARDPLNNARMAIDALLDHAPVPAENIHRIPTSVPGPVESARLYEEALRQFHGQDSLDAGRPLFSLVLMGMGRDGHTASLFPGKPEVDEKQRWAVAVPEAGMEPYVPRVSLTLPALGSSREMLFLVSGADKRDALRRIRSGEDLPAASAHSDGEAAWLVDRAAAG
ncbi:MAG TPA: 6-phosphogluconolactonase [Usitatibacter sp.]|jgi:6-phosphogluconolactonase|nr:6-phosphogluconolactonase [Usitatibacter sp.]